MPRGQAITAGGGTMMYCAKHTRRHAPAPPIIARQRTRPPHPLPRRLLLTSRTAPPPVAFEKRGRAGGRANPPEMNYVLLILTGRNAVDATNQVMSN